MKTMVIIEGRTFMVEDTTKATLIAILTAMGEEVGATATETKAETKTAKAETKTKGKGKKAPKGVKVLKVDKYGNQWIAEYDPVAYAEKKAEMIKDGTYDSKNRSKVYKALGWIL